MIVTAQPSATRPWGSNSKPSTLKPLIEAADDIESDIESGDRSTLSEKSPLLPKTLKVEMNGSISDSSHSSGSHSSASLSSGSYSMELIEQSGSTLYDSTSCLDNTPVISPNLSSLVSTLEVTGSVAELAVSIYNLHTVMTSHSVGEVDQIIGKVRTRLYAKRDKIQLELADVNSMLKKYQPERREYSELINVLNLQKADLERSRKGVDCFLDELVKIREEVQSDFHDKIGQPLVSSLLSTVSIISAEGHLPRLDFFSNLTMTALTLREMVVTNQRLQDVERESQRIMDIQMCDASGLKPLGDCLINANKREAHALQQEQWLNKIKCASWSILTAGSALSISGIVAPIATSMLVLGSLGVACCTGFKLMSTCVDSRDLSEKVKKGSMYEAVPSDILQRIEGGVDKPSMKRLAEYLDTSVEKLKTTMDLLGANDAIRVIRPEPGSSKTASLSSLSRLERG